ncbi:MAG: hypothetical protein IJ776_02695 [Paludibacteraceae bacterium]|nr:hypothetical protein [Paludibacteraceae bacterium]
MIVLSVALIILLAVMIVLIRISTKQQLQRNREELLHLREQLGDLMPPRLKALDDWKVELHTALRLADKDRPHKRGEERDQYDRQVLNHMLHYERFAEFFKQTNKRLDGFASRLKEQFSLSDREIMFVCLSALSLSDEQIALIMEYSTASIPTTRKRIGNKLGIANSADWKDRILGLINQD